MCLDDFTTINLSDRVYGCLESNPMDPTMAQDKILKTNRSSARLAKILLCEPEVAREPVFVARGMFS